jgi:hypothetical protein
MSRRKGESEILMFLHKLKNKGQNSDVGGPQIEKSSEAPGR